MKRSELAESYVTRLAKAGIKTSKEEVVKVVEFFDKHKTIPAAETAFERFTKASDDFWTSATTEARKAELADAWGDLKHISGNEPCPEGKPENEQAPAEETPGDKPSHSSLDKKRWIERAILVFLIFMTFFVTKAIYKSANNSGDLQTQVATLKKELADEKAKPKGGCSAAELQDVAEKTSAACNDAWQSRLTGKK